MTTWYEYNADSAEVEVVEYEPPAPSIGGFIINSHFRLGPHDHARWTHLFNRFYEQQKRSQMIEDTINAERRRFERADRAWRLEAR